MDTQSGQVLVSYKNKEMAHRERFNELYEVYSEKLIKLNLSQTVALTFDQSNQC